MPVTTEVTKVSPELATEWLTNNTRNRKIRKPRVTVLARDMQEGNWLFTGEAIKFADDGLLLDGQHRLHAVVKANTTVEFLIVRGLPRPVQDVLDTGAARTAADALGINGYTNTMMRAAGARWIILFKTGRIYGDSAAKTVTHTEIKDFVDDNELLDDALELSARIRKNVDALPSMVTTAIYLCMEKDRDAADLFFSRFADGANLPEDSPILALRDRLRKFRVDRVKVENTTQLSCILRAWNAWRLGKPLRQMPVYANDLPIPAPDPR